MRRAESPGCQCHKGVVQTQDIHKGGGPGGVPQLPTADVCGVSTVNTECLWGVNRQPRRVGTRTRFSYLEAFTSLRAAGPCTNASEMPADAASYDRVCRRSPGATQVVAAAGRPTSGSPDGADSPAASTGATGPGRSRRSHRTHRSVSRRVYRRSPESRRNHRSSPDLTGTTGGHRSSAGTTGPYRNHRSTGTTGLTGARGVHH